MSFKNFNIQDYNRTRQTVDLSRRVEEREKQERKSNYLEKLTDERRSDLMKIYGPKVKEPKVKELKNNIPSKTFFKKSNLCLPRKTWPFRMERNPKNNIKLHDNKMAELKIDVNKKTNIEKINYAKRFDHRKYETFKVSEYLYIPTQYLPYGGWIQHCAFCSYETTSLEQVDNYKLYCCNKCQKKYSRYEKRELCHDILTYIRQLGY